MLTLLGIVIGVATVIALMGLIEGTRQKMAHEFALRGAHVIRISKTAGWAATPEEAVAWSKRPALTRADAHALEAAPDVGRVGAYISSGGHRARSRNGATKADVVVYGTSPTYPPMAGISVSAGRYFGDVDLLSGEDVAVIGRSVARRLFPGGQALGREIRLRGHPFRVVGIQSERGMGGGHDDLDEVVYVPAQSFLNLYGRRQSLTLVVAPRSASVAGAAKREAVDILRARHRLKPKQENDFDASTDEGRNAKFDRATAVVSGVAFLICLLSLLVGGIGILNVMLVSVTERTAEIGIRKALGAKRGRILAQFVVEAVVLSLVGGVLGLFLGYGISFLVHWTAGLNAEVPVWAVVLALGIASLVGLCFGIYPAAKASRLDPVEAMRAEN